MSSQRFLKSHWFSGNYGPVKFQYNHLIFIADEPVNYSVFDERESQRRDVLGLSGNCKILYENHIL